jgi:RNA polymerase sigma-70 factor (ECF subfamily)
LSKPNLYRGVVKVKYNNINKNDMITSTFAHEEIESMDLTEKLNQFFIEHEKKAYSIAFMSLKNQDDALDVVQDVMIKFVEKYKRKKHSHWPPLFYRMIQNRVTDFHRKNTRNNKTFAKINQEDENQLENIADENYVTALAQIQSEVKIEQINQVLNALPTRQLQAFLCRVWQELSVIETAKSMKCSQGSVKTHLFRALKHIRLQLNTNVEVKNDE